MAAPFYDLVILAAGMGSRFGGLKQVEPVGPDGELIVEYSAFDARRAGFGRIVFVIRRAIEQDFRAAIGRRLEGRIEVEYTFQELDDLPAPHAPPPGRAKPWGTGHAVLAAEGAVRGPFAVINADDFYGASAYRLLAEHFRSVSDARAATDRPQYALVGYPLRQTLSAHGAVNRGICRTDATGRLAGINEVLKIELLADGAVRYPGAGGAWHPLTGEEIVSMTCFGFTPEFFGQSSGLFTEFLNFYSRSESAEFYLPVAVSQLLEDDYAVMRLLPTADRWFGLTYREDVPATRAAIRALVAAGAYPERLWD